MKISKILTMIAIAAVFSTTAIAIDSSESDAFTFDWSGTVGVPFSEKIYDTPASYLDGIYGDGLPPGISYNKNTGYFTGTPTTAGTWNMYLLYDDPSVGGGIAYYYNITISPVSAPEYTFKLAFNLQGGSGNYPTITKKSTITTSQIIVPSNGLPTKTGYSFNGWATSSTATEVEYVGGSTVSFSSPKTITLYAIWKDTSVFFDANGGTGTIPEIRGLVGSVVTLPSSGFTKEGKELLGWSTSNHPTATVTNALGSAFALQNNSTRLYAIWGDLTPVISFNANGGELTIPDQQVIWGNSINLPMGGFTADGFYLAGWTKGSTNGAFYRLGQSFAPTEPVTFYAKWAPLPDELDNNAPSVATVGQPFSYTPNLNAGDWQVYKEILRNSAFEISLTGPSWLSITTTANQIRFEGTPNETGVHLIKTTVSDSAPIESLTVYWKLTVHPAGGASTTYTVSFIPGQSASGSVASFAFIQPNNVITLPTSGEFINAGSTQVGWQTTVSGAPAVFFLGGQYTVTGNTTFTAYWVADPNIIYFDAGGGSASIDPFIAHTDDTVTLPSTGLVRSGFTFGGWHTDADPDSIYAPGYMLEVSGPVKMIAYWIPATATPITVSFNNNSGAGSLSQKVESGMNVVLPIFGFTKQNNTLLGWSTDASGTTLLNPGSRQQILNATTYYAQYQAESEIVTVTFNLSGGVGPAPIQNLILGSKAIRPDDPVRSMHIFDCWKVVGGTEWDFDDPVTTGMTLQAVWVPHFTLTSDNLVVTLTISPDYRGAPTTVSWGDGEQSTGQGMEFTHEYDRASSGLITVSSKISGVSHSSTASYAVSGDNSPPIQDEDDENDDDDTGRPLWHYIAAVFLILVIVLVIWV